MTPLPPAPSLYHRVRHYSPSASLAHQHAETPPPLASTFPPFSFMVRLSHLQTDYGCSQPHHITLLYGNPRCHTPLLFPFRPLSEITVETSPRRCLRHSQRMLNNLDFGEINSITGCVRHATPRFSSALVGSSSDSSPSLRWHTHLLFALRPCLFSDLIPDLLRNFQSIETMSPLHSGAFLLDSGVLLLPLSALVG